MPEITSIDVRADSRLRIRGSGFVDGAGTYTIGGVRVVDISAEEEPSVNGATQVEFQLPPHSFGELVVTSPGGTSVPFPVEFAHPGLGPLEAIERDVSSGVFFVIANSRVHRVDSGTMNVTTFDRLEVPRGDLHVLTSETTLGESLLPPGTLLVFADTGSVTALDPTTGVPLTTLDLNLASEVAGGIYHRRRETLFVLSERDLVEIDPVAGAEIGRVRGPSSIADKGLSASWEGDNIWVGSSRSNSLFQVQPDGTFVRVVTATGVNNDEASGILVNSPQEVFVSSIFGVIYRVDLGTELTAALPGKLAIEEERGRGHEPNAGNSPNSQLRGVPWVVPADWHMANGLIRFANWEQQNSDAALRFTLSTAGADKDDAVRRYQESADQIWSDPASRPLGAPDLGELEGLLEVVHDLLRDSVDDRDGPFAKRQ